MLIRVGILTVPTNDEEAVVALMQLLRTEVQEAVLLQTRTVGDQRNWIEETLRGWSDDEELDLILTIGGTAPAPGPSAMQTVPKATTALIERPLPGLAAAMRQYASDYSPLAWLDGGITGIRGYSLLVNLPAGAAAVLFLEGIVDLIEPLLLQLHHPEHAPTLASTIDGLAISDAAENRTEPIQPSPITDEPAVGGLDATEFAEFLQRRRKS